MISPASVLRPLAGLFVDDAEFALAILGWVLAATVLPPLLHLSAAAEGGLLFGGPAVILLSACLRRAASGGKTADAVSGGGKVPAVTFGFWVIKIAATTLGETGGDALSMTFKLGYAVSSVVFIVFFVALVAAQIRARRFHPLLYWAVIVATTTAGTTMADFADRSMGVGYIGGSLILFGLLLAVLGLWWKVEGSVAADRIASPRIEAFYWATILFSNTLGTALGDFLADSSGLGYEGGAAVFAGLLALIAAAYFFTRLSRVALFWMAFILTRPLGATVGDLLTKPVSHGGLDLSRVTSSLILLAFMIGAILVLPQRTGGHGGTPAGRSR